MKVPDVRHLAQTGEWYSPPKEIACERSILGGISLDPCGSDESNTIVRALTVWGEEDDSLNRPWYDGGFRPTAHVNPPGTCLLIEVECEPYQKKDGTWTNLRNQYATCENKSRCSCALPGQFLRKSIHEASLGMDIIYLAYNMSQTRQLSKIDIPDNLIVSIAIPPERIPYIDPTTMEPVRGTNADSAFICLSTNWGLHKTFALEMRKQLGCRVYTMQQLQGFTESQ